MELRNGDALQREEEKVVAREIQSRLVQLEEEVGGTFGIFGENVHLLVAKGAGWLVAEDFDRFTDGRR